MESSKVPHIKEKITPHFRNLIASLPPEEALCLKRQFSYSSEEEKHTVGFSDDPLDEVFQEELEGSIRKYKSKLLLLVSEECPLLCRYCTRKRVTFLHRQEVLPPAKDVKQYLLRNPEINEIIFSGGDPFMLPDRILQTYLGELQSVNTLKIFRWHTRMTTSVPRRFGQRTISWLESFSKSQPDRFLVIVSHVNHAGEISRESTEVFKKLKEAGVQLYSQSVLLKNVNDSVKVLSELFQTLLKHGVQPYYLHQLDRVSGSMHFEVSEQKGKELMQQLRERLPPFMLPRYVRDSSRGKKAIFC